MRRVLMVPLETFLRTSFIFDLFFSIDLNY